MTRAWRSCAALILLSAAACSEDEGPADVNLHGYWVLVAATYQGHEYDFTRSASPLRFPDASLVVPGRTRALQFGRQPQARTGCQSAAVDLEVSGDDVAISVDEVYLEPCLAGSVDPMVGNYFKALDTVERGSISGGDLTLSGPATTLTFRHPRAIRS
jgi:hypothetical protein